MIPTIDRWVRTRSTSQAWTNSIGGLVLIGIADWITGPSIGFSIFYVIPVFGASWRFGRRKGFLMAFACAVVWGWVDFMTRPGEHVWIPLWNFDVGFVLLATFAAIVARIKDQMTRQATLTRELRDALAEVDRLSGLLRMCAWCRRIRNDEGEWEPFEVYVMEHADIDISHGICPDCAAKREAEKVQSSAESQQQV